MTEQTVVNSPGSNPDAMATAAALKAAKRELRNVMKAKLSKLSSKSLEAQSDAAFNALIEFPPYQQAKRISVYLSMPGGEIQTDRIVSHALQNDKHVFVPYLHKPDGELGHMPKRVMDMVQLKSEKDFRDLKRDAWGIPTVSAEDISGRTRILNDIGQEVKEAQGGLDLVLLPGVAFEQDMDEGISMIKRLGHGKGFYDYFLHRYRNLYEGGKENEHVKLFGLGLQEQFLQGGSVPVGPHDTPLTGLIVGDGTIVDTADQI